MRKRFRSVLIVKAEAYHTKEVLTLWGQRIVLALNTLERLRNRHSSSGCVIQGLQLW